MEEEVSEEEMALEEEGTMDAWLLKQPGGNHLEKFAIHFGTELRQRSQGVVQEIEDADEVLVMVSAFGHGTGRDPVRLHVENFDNIQGKSSTVTPKSGLKLSEYERERLQRDLDQARSAVGKLKELEATLKDSVDGAQDLGDKLEAVLANLRDELKAVFGQLPQVSEDGTSLDSVQATLENVVAILGQVDVGAASGKSAEQIAAITSLMALAQDSVATVQSIDATVKLSEELFDRDFDLKNELAKLALGTSDLPDKARDLKDQVNKSITSLKDLAAVASDAKDAVAQAATLATVQGLAPAELISAMEEWKKTVGPLLEVVDLVSTALGGPEDGFGAAAALVRADDGVSLPRMPDNLRDGLVSLGENVEVGDRVRVILSVTSLDGEEELDKETFDFYVTDMGWRRDVRGEAIFARGDSGGKAATDWKPNISAMSTWHYRYRRPEGDWGRFVNWLDPGIGIHAASLDQDPDEGAEFGIGLQARFKNGLFFVGVGQNLSAEDETYYFVGTDLFRLLGNLSE